MEAPGGHRGGGEGDRAQRREADVGVRGLDRGTALLAQRDDEGIITARNGTAFFLRTPDALFGVTAAHVVEGPGGWRESCV